MVVTTYAEPTRGKDYRPWEQKILKSKQFERFHSISAMVEFRRFSHEVRFLGLGEFVFTSGIILAKVGLGAATGGFCTRTEDQYVGGTIGMRFQW
jgi:hypothetical protein